MNGVEFLAALVGLVLAVIAALAESLADLRGRVTALEDAVEEQQK